VTYRMVCFLYHYPSTALSKSSARCCEVNRDSSNRCSDGLWAGRLGLNFQMGKLFLFSAASRPTVEFTQPLMQSVLGAISSE
jgi:hypothetical protein